MLRERIEAGIGRVHNAYALGGIRAVGAFLGSRLYRRSQSLLFCCRELPALPVLPPDLSIERITAGEADDFLQDLLRAGAGEDLHLFGRGAVCYLARWSGEPAGAGWVFADSYLLRRAGLGGKARYLGACQVAEAFRGRGIYTNLLRTMANDALAAGFEPYIDTSCDNVASQRGILKAGFVHKGMLSAIVLFGFIVNCTISSQTHARIQQQG
jgi:GNAT superfamily N-acetyltransferase